MPMKLDICLYMLVLSVGIPQKVDRCNTTHVDTVMQEARGNHKRSV